MEFGPVSSQLFDVIVDGLGEIHVGNAGLLFENQVVPDAAKLLKVRGDGLGTCFLTPPAFLLLMAMTWWRAGGFPERTAKNPRISTRVYWTFIGDAGEGWKLSH
jgi:hypothetical protein